MENEYFARDWENYHSIAQARGLQDKVITGVRLNTEYQDYIHLELLSNQNKEGRFLNFSLIFTNMAYRPIGKPVRIGSAYQRRTGIELPSDPSLLVANALTLDEYGLVLEDAYEDSDPEKFTAVFFDPNTGKPEMLYETPENDELRIILKKNRRDNEVSRYLIDKIIEFWAKDGFRKSRKKK